MRESVTYHDWLEIAAAGMGLLGLLMAGWYTAAKYRDRVQRSADAKLALLDESSGIALLLGESGVDKEQSETGPEEIVGARLARLNEPLLDVIAGWGKQLWRRLGPFGRLRLPLLAVASLPLLALYLALCALLLPLIVARYVFDLDQDFRLRIIVLAFAFGTALKIMAALDG